MNRYALLRAIAADAPHREDAAGLDLGNYPSWAHELMRQIYAKLDVAGRLAEPLELQAFEAPTDTAIAAGPEDDALHPIYGKNPPDGGGDRCMLMPGIQRYGMCLYLCPGGGVLRAPKPGKFACPPFRHRGEGLHPWEKGPGPEGPIQE